MFQQNNLIFEKSKATFLQGPTLQGAVAANGGRRLDRPGKGQDVRLFWWTFHFTLLYWLHVACLQVWPRFLMQFSAARCSFCSFSGESTLRMFDSAAEFPPSRAEELLVCLPVFGCLFPDSLCFFACLSSFTDWCTAHRQQFREQQKIAVRKSYSATAKRSSSAKCRCPLA